MSEIQDITGKIDFNNLTYYFKGSNIAPITFISFRGPLNIFKEIKNGDISLKKQWKIKTNLNQI